MAVTTSSVTVGTTATALCGTDPERRTIVFHNAHTDKVFIGGPGVTTSNGLHLNKDEKIVLSNSTPADCTAKNAFYAIIGSGTAPVSVMEVTD